MRWDGITQRQRACSSLLSSCIPSWLAWPNTVWRKQLLLRVSLVKPSWDIDLRLPHGEVGYSGSRVGTHTENQRVLPSKVSPSTCAPPPLPFQQGHSWNWVKPAGKPPHPAYRIARNAAWLIQTTNWGWLITHRVNGTGAGNPRWRQRQWRQWCQFLNHGTQNVLLRILGCRELPSKVVGVMWGDTSQSLACVEHVVVKYIAEFNRRSFPCLLPPPSSLCPPFSRPTFSSCASAFS